MTRDESFQQGTPLSRIQRWMQAVITHPDGVEHGVQSDPARSQIGVSPQDVEQVIRPSKNLSSLSRLEIYANAYYQRLLECLQDEFPALVAALGEEAFNGFAFGYLQSYPSTSYTLSELGAKFPQYLAETRPDRESENEAPDWADFLVDLARLERLYSEVFDGPGIEKSEVLKPETLLAIPPTRWNEVRFEPAPCLRLETFRFPVHVFASMVRHEDDDETITFPEPAETCLAVSRIKYRVRRWSLSQRQYRLLQELISGSSLQSALEIAFADAGEDDAALAAQLREWFEEWSAAGFFLGVSLDEQPL